MRGLKPALTNGGPPLTPCPAPPKWLPPYAKAEWKRVGQILHENGVLRQDTMQLFESYCVSVASIREAEEILQKEGRVQGDKVHPAYRLMNLAQKESRILAGELGLTPSRRPQVEKGDDGDDALGL